MNNETTPIRMFRLVAVTDVCVADRQWETVTNEFETDIVGDLVRLGVKSLGKRCKVQLVTEEGSVLFDSRDYHAVLEAKKVLKALLVA